MSNRTIARLRGISLDAVKFHVENAIAKLGLESRAALRTWRGAPADSALARRQQREDTEVAELQLGPIGQVARAVKDISKAEAWYRDVLGLPHLYTYGKLAFFDCDGTRLFLEESSGIETPNLKNDSVLYFRVPDIHAATSELESRGVKFVSAPHMIFKHPDGMEEWMAFFEDCDGGVLSIMSQVRST
jgi:catechol 2,3-dioxygenase-like lactoylglutathione lyase family enzyme